MSECKDPFVFAMELRPLIEKAPHLFAAWIARAAQVCWIEHRDGIYTDSDRLVDDLDTIIKIAQKDATP